MYLPAPKKAERRKPAEMRSDSPGGAIVTFLAGVERLRAARVAIGEERLKTGDLLLGHLDLGCSSTQETTSGKKPEANCWMGFPGGLERVRSLVGAVREP